MKHMLSENPNGPKIEEKKRQKVRPEKSMLNFEVSLLVLKTGSTDRVLRALICGMRANGHLCLFERI